MPQDELVVTELRVQLDRIEATLQRPGFFTGDDRRGTGRQITNAEVRSVDPMVDPADPRRAFTDLPRHLERPEKPVDQRKGADGQGKGDEGGASADDADATADVREGELGKDPQLDHALELLKSWQVFKTFVARRDG